MMKNMKTWFVFEGSDVTESYRMLGIIKGALKVLSWLSIILGILFFFVILIFGGSTDAPRAVSILALLLGIIYFIMFYVVACGIELLVSIEANTRKTTLLLGGREK